MPPRVFSFSAQNTHWRALDHVPRNRPQPRPPHTVAWARAARSAPRPGSSGGTFMSVKDRLTHLQLLEAESIHILREVASEFQRPVMLYSIGKDSSVMLRLAQKAFHPGPIPFPLLHVDTGYKFREMLEFRDRYTAELGVKLIVWRNEEALANGANPVALGTQRCCGLLKTQALLDALRAHGFDAAFGGARRDEEKSRAKERIFSFRDAAGQWDPKNQRPELWSLFNARIAPGESIRVFPLSNWTELDIWHYIHLENIPIVPLYLAKERRMLVRSDGLIPAEQPFVKGLPGEEQWVKCRLRSLGCSPCTGAIRSDADTVPKIIAELMEVRNSERANRIIDHDQDGSMELKKREGYF
ncbi:MAG TPA: sulfate adenylyltransferase subunit CysD [Terracidiphilus sp.]|nr:sulfate adenylyltransferase subunit CysD [Terracidiphilus sp.]